MKWKNLTPHPIHIYDGGELMLTIPSHGLARCAVEEENYGRDENSIPLIGMKFGQIEGLLYPAPDTGYIVSAIVANAARAQGRMDVAVPARLVRNEAGIIVGCSALAIK